MRKVLIWDFGNSDECKILICSLSPIGNIEIEREFKDSGKKIQWYLDIVNNEIGRHNISINHLPKCAYCKTINSGKSIYEIFKENDFIVNEP